MNIGVSATNKHCLIQYARILSFKAEIITGRIRLKI